MVLCAVVEAAGADEVPDAEQGFGDREGLGEEVSCSGGEGSLFGLRGDVGGDDDDGQVRGFGQLVELSKDLVAVGWGHVQVKENDVGLEAVHPVEDLGRVRGAEHVFDSDAVQQLGEHRDIQRFVVDDEHTGLGFGSVDHRATSRELAGPIAFPARTFSMSSINSPRSSGFVRYASAP